MDLKINAINIEHFLNNNNYYSNLNWSIDTLNRWIESINDPALLSIRFYIIKQQKEGLTKKEKKILHNLFEDNRDRIVSLLEKL